MTGANGQVGRALLRALSVRNTPTVALVRRPADLPADRVIVGAFDAPEAAAVLRGADCVVHLAGTLRPRPGEYYETANALAAESVAGALRGSRVSRVLFLSYVGARAGDENAYLRTKAAAERALVESGVPVVTFRCAHVIGPPAEPGPTAAALLARPGRSVVVLGDGRQRVAPVVRDDVVGALVAAMHGGKPGVYPLTGPDEMSLDDLVRLLNRDPRVGIWHVPVWLARRLGTLVPAMPGPLVDVMLRDSVGDHSAAVAEFGLSLTSLHDAWSTPASEVAGVAPPRPEPR